MAWFAYSGEQVLAEYEDSGALDAFQPSRKFVYGAYVDEPLLLLSCSELAGGGRTETAYYYHQDRNFNHQDRNFNVIAMTDDTGQLVDRYSYSAYGEIETLTNGGTKITANPYFFTGRRFDAELRIYYYRARYHDPALGRFLSRDPLEYVDGMSLYEYVKGMPLVGLDPDGKGFLSRWWCGADDCNNEETNQIHTWIQKEKISEVRMIKDGVCGTLETWRHLSGTAGQSHSVAEGRGQFKMVDKFRADQDQEACKCEVMNSGGGSIEQMENSWDTSLRQIPRAITIDGQFDYFVGSIGLRYTFDLDGKQSGFSLKQGVGAYWIGPAAGVGVVNDLTPNQSANLDFPVHNLSAAAGVGGEVSYNHEMVSTGLLFGIGGSSAVEANPLGLLGQ